MKMVNQKIKHSDEEQWGRKKTVADTQITFQLIRVYFYSFG